MTTERSEGYKTPLAGLPLFTQPVPPIARHSIVRNRMDTTTALDMIAALDDRVVVEHAARAGAHAHRHDPLGVGHLVVDLADDGSHLLADPPGDDHEVGLARRRAEDLLAPAARVEARGAEGHHLDGAARQAEGGRPERRAP